MLEIRHIELITQTRELLQKLEHDTLSQIRYPYGRFGEACRSADDALFQVLLIAKHWLEDDLPELEREEEIA